MPTPTIKFSDFVDGNDVQVGDQVVGLRSGANYRFSFPGAGVRDANGNYMLGWNTVGATAVNYPDITNSITTNSIIYGAAGSDPDIGINVTPKGTGVLQLDGINWPTTIGPSGYALLSDGVDTLTFGTIGDMGWSIIAGTTQSAAVNSGYISSNAGATTVTLPVTAALGAVVALEGLGAGGWILQAGVGQTIMIGSGTTSSGGTLTSAAATDNVYVTAIVADTTWRVRTTNSSGLTIA